MGIDKKELLLKDLSARLPYGVIVNLDDKFKFNKGDRVLVKELLDLYCVEGIKPYLRPLSSMTEEEKEEYHKLCDSYDGIYFDSVNSIDWLNKHHFDYRGLVPKNLAIEITEENNPYASS